MSLAKLRSISRGAIDDEYRQQSRERQVIEDYGSMFHPHNLGQLTADQFKSFLVYRNNRHWKGINRHGPRLTADMDHLRRMLFILVDEYRPLRERLNILFPSRGRKPLSGMGMSTATPILFITYPDRYGVFNEPSRAGLEAFGLFPDLPANASLAQEYIAVNRVLLCTAYELQISLWELDYLWWYVADRGLIT